MRLAAACVWGLALPLALHAPCARAEGVPSLSGKVRSAEIVGRNIVIDIEGGSEVTIRPDDSETTLSDVQLAGDRRTVGWVVSNDVTEVSHPGEKPLVILSDVPNTLAVWRDGHVRHDFNLLGGFVIWHFWQGGREVAYHVGPSHFDDEQDTVVDDSTTGRRLGEWKASDNVPIPDWARGLVDEASLPVKRANPGPHHPG